MNEYNDKILGKGITFPFQLVDGKIIIESDVALIRKSIISILNWPVGTRYFNSEYGSMLKDLLEDPNDIVLEGLVRRYIIEAITKWETRIKLLVPPQIYREDNKINIRLTYEIIKTAQQDSFVFPFYQTIKY